VSSWHPLNHKILRNAKIAFGSNVRDRLRISHCSGCAKNLRAPCFGEKVENFGGLWVFGRVNAEQSFVDLHQCDNQQGL
ncbi:MAG: hypothetical protein LBS23_03390, partial [Holosporaceae bacterium]|nr:hypothetical protein [Holosporaceae bacterium]